MKKLLIFLIVMFIGFTPKRVNAQDELGAAIGGLITVGAIVAAREQLKEEFELFATDYMLENYDLKAFELKINGLNDKSKTFDPSSISVLSFNITPVDYDYGSMLYWEKIALLVFLDSGWKNEFGIDVTKIKYAPFTLDEWNALLSKYISIASGADIVNNEIPVYEKTNFGENKLMVGGVVYSKSERTVNIKDVEIRREGVFLKEQIILPFKKASGDTYFVFDYSDEYKLLYNEKSLGLFIKEIDRLVQIKISLVKDITDFLNKK